MAVTGLGAVTALADGAGPLLQALCEGRRAIGPGPWESPGWAAACRPGPRPRATELALAAARQATTGLADCGGLWVVAGSTGADMAQSEDAWLSGRSGEAVAAGELLWPQLPERVAQVVQTAMGAEGWLSLSTACTSGAAAVGVAASLIRSGRARAALAVGADAICRVTWSGFGSLRLQATGPCRPFDRDRNGLNLGDGAGALLLEPLEAVLARGDSPLAELIGYGECVDAYHLSTPHPDGRGLRRAIREAVDEHPGPDWICAHGTGTLKNDAVEAGVLGDLFPDRPVSGIKGAIGHTLGAAGALEAVIAVQSLLEGRAPPTAGLETPGVPLSLLQAVREGPLARCLSVNLAFGGGNTALYFARPPARAQ